MAQLSFAIIGTGAIGGYYGAKLQRAGHEVHFLLRSDYDYVRTHGLKVQSFQGDFSLPEVQAYNKVEEMPKVDVVIVALKTTQQSLLAELLPPLLKENTQVVLIQNGVGVEEATQGLVPEARLVGGLAFICVDKPAEGFIRHQQNGSINLASYSSTPEEVEQLAEVFNHAELPAKTMDHATARWGKALWNMPFNGLCTVMRTTTDRTVKEPHARALVEAMMREVVAGAQACGVTALTQATIDASIAYTEAMTPYSPSMKLDFEFHRPMEIEYLYHRPIALAEAHGAQMPLLKMLAAQLELLEANAKEGL